MADNFERHVARTATQIGKLVITIAGYELDEQGNQPDVGIHYSVVLRDADGQRVAHPQDTGDLRPYLTAGQISTIESFLASMQTKTQGLLS